MQIPGRSASSGSGYRYGFNGKEKSDEINGSGVDYDYGLRIYDSRIGKFLSVDGLTKNYPWYTPYQFAGDKPIWCIDIDGAEEQIVTIYKDINGNRHTQTYKANEFELAEWTSLQKTYAMGFGNSSSAQGYQWIGGYQTYKSFSPGDINNIEWRGPGKGTLTIDATGNIIKLNYDDQKVKGIDGNKSPSLSKSIAMGWKGFKTFFITPDPLVEGSSEFKETIDRVIEVSGLIIGAGELGESKKVLDLIKGSANLVSTLDDLTKFSENKIKNKNLKAIVETLKTALSVVNLNDAYKVLSNKKANIVEKFPKALGTVSDFKGLADYLKDKFKSIEKSEKSSSEIK